MQKFLMLLLSIFMFSVGSSSIVYGGEIRTKTEGPISEYIIVYKDGNIELVTTNPNSKNKQAKIVDGNYLKDKNNVEYVQPNIEYVTFKTPNDPKFMFQQNLQISQFNTVTFWDRGVGGTTNVVAVLDSGVDINHPDLKDNIYKSPKEVKNGKDDDGNGYVDDLNGWNTVTNTGEMYDDNGHGTHCAGIIGATTNNSIGVAGINWNVKILPVKFMDYAGRGNTYAMVKAIDYIVKLKKSGVNIVSVNCSFGTYSKDQLMETYLKKLNDLGIIVVTAAGNESNNTDLTPCYPATLNLQNQINVAAVDSNGNLASFSNYGKNTVDVAAPGVSILSTYPNGYLAYSSGTSMAAPHVAGLVALIKAFNPGLSESSIKGYIISKSASTQTNSTQNNIKSGGFINCGLVLTLINGGTPVIPTQVPTITPTITKVPTVTLTPTVRPTVTKAPTVTPTPTPVVIATPTKSPTGSPVYENVIFSSMSPSGRLNSKSLNFNFRVLANTKISYYYVYFSGYGGGTQPCVKLVNTTSYRFPWSIPSGKYWWKVEAYTVSGKKFTSNVSNFEVPVGVKNYDVGVFEVIDINSGVQVIPNGDDIKTTENNSGGCNVSGHLSLLITFSLILGLLFVKK